MGQTGWLIFWSEQPSQNPRNDDKGFGLGWARFLYPEKRLAEGSFRLFAGRTAGKRLVGPSLAGNTLTLCWLMLLFPITPLNTGKAQGRSPALLLFQNREVSFGSVHLLPVSNEEMQFFVCI